MILVVAFPITFVDQVVWLTFGFLLFFFFLVHRLLFPRSFGNACNEQKQEHCRIIVSGLLVKVCG